MNLQEMRNFLKEIFLKPLDNGKKRHIVFWYDENEDFIDEISNILIYSNIKKPDPQEYWLYDIFSYS